jgi:phosphohistidine phosphatase
MNRRLIVMRHAKSSWNSDAPTDHERPLNGRGRRDAPRMARALLEHGWAPQAVISSDSQRTRETWAGMSSILTDVSSTFTYELYHAGMGELRKVLMQQPADHRCLLVLGHNPGWEYVVQFLTGEDHPMTTANCALLTGHGATWDDAVKEPGTWRVDIILRPKEL